MRQLAEAARPVWAEMLRRHAAGRPRFNEEAHLLSYLYHRLGIESGTANAFIDRIYTSLKDGKTVAPRHLDLMLWHLPNEKRYGLRRLFPDVLDRDSWFWTAPPDRWRRRLGRTLGVPATHAAQGRPGRGRGRPRQDAGGTGASARARSGRAAPATASRTVSGL